MRAAVCREFGKPLDIEDVRLAPPAREEIRVSVRACGICQSDLHYMAGAWAGELPAVFGHEVGGIVDEVGPAVGDLRVGDHVVVGLVRCCGRCPSCASGQPALCEGDFHLDEETPLRDGDGRSVRQGTRTAGFAESVVVHASQAVAIPDGLAFEAACLLACAVMTGVGAVVNTARVQPGQSVAVIGAGGVGLNAVQGSALAGAQPVIAIDVCPRKLDAARFFGATHAVDGRQENAEDQLRRLTAQRGADVVVVTVGAPSAVEQAIRMTRRGGTVVVVGMPASGAASRLDAGQVAHDGQRILGSKMGSSVPRVDIPRLISLYRDGRLKLDELVSNRFPLGRINEAVESSRQGEAIRNVITFPS